jgi:hypothetical protein
LRKIVCQTLILLILASKTCTAQHIDSLDCILTTPRLPDKYYSKVDKKISSINDHLSKKSINYLGKFQKRERKIQEKLAKLNPGWVSNDASVKYKEFFQKLSSKSYEAPSTSISGEYNPNLDSLRSSLSFLKQFNGIRDKVKEPLESLNQLQNKLQQSENMKAFIAERKNQIKEILSKYTNLSGSLKNQYAKLNKTAYYYSAQVKEYRDILKDPDKMEQKALAILRDVPAFQKFMKENSQLGNLFGVPANYGNPESLAGLQTLDQVQQLVKNRIGNGPNAAVMLQQQVQAAQVELNKFKDKLDKLGGGSGDMAIPEFKPNNQKTKPFLQRLEYRSNLQTTRGNYYFPTTTELGLSVGYKLKNKILLGLGMSYKQGWGNDFSHIHLTSEGIGLRSFFEYHLKKSFYATGGFEYNYQQPFNFLRMPKYDKTQRSGLIGLSKMFNIKSKVFKKTNIEFLWDFLSYQQIPRTQPLKFRVGYNF